MLEIVFDENYVLKSIHFLEIIKNKYDFLETELSNLDCYLLAQNE